jgi:hypothetical protein
MIFLLTFANDSKDFLKLLKAECEDIKKMLRPLERKGFIKFEDDDSATLQDITDMLMSHTEGVGFFHYAGHADGTEILLEGGGGNAKGIAQLLGEQPDLKLVFLNGCSTKGQVELLFAAGVKAVIATSRPINDPKAKDFAVAFYEALANKRTIKRAFDLAKGVLEAKYKVTPAITTTRAIGKIGVKIAEEIGEEWTLYYKDGFEDEIGDFRLPTYREIPISMEQVQSSVSANRMLLHALPEMCNYNKDIFTQMEAMQKGNVVKKDSSSYLDLVVENFPFVIGSQIRLLRIKTENNLERLQQLTSTYITLGRTLLYILLADAWNLKNRMKKDFMTPKDFAKGFVMSRNDYGVFPYFEKIATLYNLIPADERDNLFVPEFKQLVENLQDDAHFTTKSVKFFEILRGSLLDPKSLEAGTIEKQCAVAEQALTRILMQSAFLAGYQMLGVRSISLNNPRTKGISYELNMARLHAIDHVSLGFYFDEPYRRKLHYTNCDSVVLAVGSDILSEADALNYYLNLSPFIIDKNTFLEKPHVDLYFFAYDNAETYVYHSIMHDVFTAFNNEKGTESIHTGLTKGDFQEGKNITEQAASDVADDFGFGLSAPATTKVLRDPTPIFAELEEQFEQLKTEFA